MPPPPECELDLPKPGGVAGEAPRGLRCGGGRSGFNVTWNGELIPCNRLRHLAAKPLETGFREAWKFVNTQAENYLLPCECETCPYQPAAKTCAAAHMAAEPGHVDREQCKWCKAMVRAGFAKLK